MNCPNPKCGSRNLRSYYSVPYDGINCTKKRMICAECETRFNAVTLIGDVRVKNEDANTIELSAEYEGCVFVARVEPD